MKKYLIFAILFGLIFSGLSVTTMAQPELEGVEAAILMEASTGKVLYEKNADDEHIPASVTKVMTMLIIMDKIASGELKYDDMVTTSAYAASMGGSQVFLKEGEQFSVTDMLKSITMASANDACVAMAEHISGSEEAFVAQMNERARGLGMSHTNFENTNGLDDTVTQHYTSARDIAVMSRELITKHPEILDFTSVWMDTVRNGAFGLTNTNRLIRFYKGANGLKTGSTSKAGFCISATAKRDGMQLIAVIMKSTDRDTRNEAAKKLLDYGFANYATVSFGADTLSNQVVGGTIDKTADYYIPPYNDVLDKASAQTVKRRVILNENITAPLKIGDKVGVVEYRVSDKLIHQDEVVASENVNKVTYFGIVLKMFMSIFSA